MPGSRALPKCAADAMIAHIRSELRGPSGIRRGASATSPATRSVCADLIGADKSEIALLGPTSLGLSLFANGLSWRAGDEVVCYQDDYPSNVYPWMALASQGVQIRRLCDRRNRGVSLRSSWSAYCLPRTRLVALASCHYLSGWRIDVDAIGALLQETWRPVFRGRHSDARRLSVQREVRRFLERGCSQMDARADGDRHRLRGAAELSSCAVRPCIGSWNVHSPQLPRAGDNDVR